MHFWHLKIRTMYNRQNYQRALNVIWHCGYQRFQLKEDITENFSEVFTTYTIFILSTYCTEA